MPKKPRGEPDTAASPEQYCYLSDVSPSDKPWDTHRANADLVRDGYIKLGYQRYADRIELCSRQLEFTLRLKDKSQRAFKLLNTRFCRVRHCPVCQWRRSLMWRARFFQSLPKLLEDYPNHKFLFLTLTVKNCPLEELRANLTWMNKSWEKLTKRKQFPAVGWVKAVEVTKAKDNQAHPHFHAILMVPSSYFQGKLYLSHRNWLELWKSCLRVDYEPWVNIKAVRPKFGGSEDDKAKALDKIAHALCETLKYSVKEADLISDPQWLGELTKQLHKTRAVAVGGLFKDYLSDKEPEDLINSGLEDDEVSESDPKFWFGWRERYKRYQSM